jgi:O-antigen/teichoic acid export membrane protein
MSLRKQAVKNVTATWLGLVVHAVTGFFLSPFILHRLGDEAFSLWVLIFAVTGYFGLLDFGIRSSIVKYTAKFIATKDEEQLSRYLSTAVAFYAAMAVFVLLGTIAGFFSLRLLFRIPAGMLHSARILFLLAGIGVAVTFPLNVFTGALEGLQKFSWLQLSQMGVVLFRAALIILVLLNGRGLLAIGIVTVGTNVVSYFIFTFLALYELPAVLRWRHVDVKVFREMAVYGVFAFAILVAEKLRFQSDALVIGALVSSAAITFFSIASRLVEYAGYAVRSMSQIFTPMSSQFHATGDLLRLQRTFIAGNRASALIIFPICAALLILGKAIIEAWVGARYVVSYSVLAVLIVPRSLYLAQSTSIRILLGMGRHRVLAAVLVLEGGVNLLLSLLLARRFGIVGVAWGTAIPLACTSLFFLPQHLCRVLEMPLATFVRRAYGLPVVLNGLMAAALWFIGYQVPVHTYAGVALELAGGGLVYGAGLAWALLDSGYSRAQSWDAVVRLLEPNRNA